MDNLNTNPLAWGLQQDTAGLKTRLKAILLNKSLTIAPEGQPFTLASGQKSPYYINGKLTTCDPEGLFCLSRIILEHLADQSPQAIGGPTLGADPIVSGVSVLSYLLNRPLPLFIVRKEPKGHGTQSQIEGVDIANKRVVLVEDVITTGGSLMKAVEAVKRLGGAITDIMCIVDREQGGGETFAKAGLPFSPIFTISELLPAEARDRLQQDE